MPEISVIVPIYNAENFLGTTISAILNQSYRDFELLLVNDGSTDRSLEICNHYAEQDDRIIVFSKDNGGESSARNYGLTKASGKWIAFADADDEIGKDWLKLYVDNLSDDISIVIQGFTIKINGLVDSKRGEDFLLPPSQAIAELLVMGVIGYTWCKLFNRQIIEDNALRFDERIIFKCDEEFCLRYFSYSNNVKSLSAGEYIYHMPQWNKYDHVDNFYCNCCELKTILKIKVADNVEQHFKEQAYRSYFVDISKRQFRDNVQRLKFLREVSDNGVPLSVSHTSSFIFKYFDPIMATAIFMIKDLCKRKC